MNKSIRSSLIAISITIALTALKFIFYYISGSIAVLSEAWHSFSDITTSLLVLFALFRSSSVKKSASEKIDQKAEKEDTNRNSRLRELIKNLLGENIEATTSLIIGIFLTFISISLIINVYNTSIVLIENPLITGIIFLVLSLGSFFLSKFLSDVGKAENSPALISDGLHSKGDLVCSSLTGLSLILYHFRFNIDRWVSLAIALFILSFGIEIIINIIINFHKKEKEFRMNYRIFEIFNFILTKETYIRLFKWIDTEYSIDILKSKLFIQLVRLLKFSGYTLAVLFVLSVFYDMGFQVQMDEEAIVERFGKPVTKEALKPGLHFKFPRPIDMVKKEKTKQVQELYLGNISREKEKPLIWGKTHGEEVHFISGDNNFFNPYIIIHYRIKDLYKYYYNLSNPQVLIEDITYKTLQNVFTSKSFYEIAITYRKEIDFAVEKALQQELDKLNTGIEVISVNVKDIHPPIKISKSFEEVIAAYQEKEEIINLALEYQNSEIPSSRGQAYKDISNANAYVNEEILKSIGAVTGYRSKLESYKNAKSIIRKILYYNHIAESMTKNNKIIVDPKTGKPNLLLRSGNNTAFDDWTMEE